MNKFLSEVKGFTPVIDILAQEAGLMTAIVYGIVWRYCQAEDKICTVSMQTIASHVGISVKTVKRHLHWLEYDEGDWLRKEPIIPASRLSPSVDNARCEYCHITFSHPDRHHIISISEGGSDIPHNITYLCPNCHRLAHRMGYRTDLQILTDGWKFKDE